MSEPKSAHKSTARTFRLGDQAESHIAEIAARLSVLRESAVTDTDAIRHALAETAKKLRKNNSKKNPD